MASSSEDEEQDLLDPITNIGNRRTIHAYPGLLYFLTGLSGVGGFLFGYDTGVVSGAMVLVVKEFKLTDLWHSLIVSGTIFSAFITSVLSGFFIDRCGRRYTILLASVAFLIGSIVMGVSQTKLVLFFGRLIVGIGVGLASTAVPLYISECSPVDKRGELVTINQLAITGGQLVAGLVCGTLSSVDTTDGNSWRWMLGLAVIPAAVQLVGFSFMPESPRHLVKVGRYREAEQVLCSIRGPYHQIQDELEDIKIACGQEPNLSSNNVLSQFVQNRPAMKALVVGCLLQATQQVAGINTVMYYAASILEMAGAGPKLAIWLSALTAAINFIFSIVGLKLVGVFKRRTLLFSSLLLVVISLLVIAASFKYMIWSSSTETGSLTGPVLVLFSLCFYLIAFAPGLGPLPWTINSELHPSWCRASSVSIATATNWATNLIVSLTFLNLTNVMGRPLTFVLYALLTGTGSIFLFLSLPETKGKSLEEADHLFETRIGRRSMGEENSSRFGLYSTVPVVDE